MLQEINLQNILFLDIETVPEKEEFEELTTTQQELFEHKTAYRRKEEISASAFYDNAGIWAEFGKIVCISVGYFAFTINHRHFRLKSFVGEEKELLIAFNKVLNTYFNKKEDALCAHNGKEFDFPYIARRMIINQIALPNKLNLFGKKPWEVNHIDTLELWKFGDYKHYTSLKLLTNILGIASPKDDINGSEVAQVYYKDKDIKRIAVYCEKDVLAIAQVLLKFKLEPLLNKEEIVSVNL